MSTLPFVAAYTKASGSQQAKAAGLSVTCSVYRVTLADGTVTRLVDAAAATELAATGTTGAYFYQYTATLDFTAYWYFATFSTADTSVQQVDIAAAWFDYPLASADALAAIRAQTDLITTGGTVNVAVPVWLDGSVRLTAGDDYRAAENRALSWTDPGQLWPDLTGASVAFAAYKGATVYLSAPGSVLVATGAGKKVQVELTSAQTAAAGVRSADTAKAVATLPSGSSVTLAKGPLSVSF